MAEITKINIKGVDYDIGGTGGGTGSGKVIVNATETNELDSEFNIKNLIESGTGAIRVYKLDRDLTENDNLENLIIKCSLLNLGELQFTHFKDSVFVMDSININYTPVANLGVLSVYGVLVKGELGFYFVFQFSLIADGYFKLNLELGAQNTVSRYDTIVLFQLLKNNLLSINNYVFTLSTINTTDLAFLASCFSDNLLMLVLENEMLLMISYE